MISGDDPTVCTDPSETASPSALAKMPLRRGAQKFAFLLRRSQELRA
jgi:hypothetical protein